MKTSAWRHLFLKGKLAKIHAIEVVKQCQTKDCTTTNIFTTKMDQTMGRLK